jgi:ankyrin repeat protein
MDNHQFDHIFQNIENHRCQTIREASSNNHRNCMLALLNHEAVSLCVSNAKDDDGYAPIHTASINGSYESLKLLLEQGADIDDISDHGWTALHYAVGYANNEYIRILQGIGPCNSNECIKVLLDRGADINKKNSGGLNAFEMANNQTKEFIEKWIVENEIPIKEPCESSSQC